MKIRVPRLPLAPPAAAGMTLIELLVVLAVIGVLAALLLPAIQGAREAARRLNCLNNLHQIGVALHAHHEAKKAFPPGGIEPISPKWPKGRQLAWSAFLLPYLEQAGLHDRVDFTKAFDSPENAAAAAMVVPCYVCPSVPRASYLISGRAVCDYGGMYGERITGPNKPPKGAMLYDRAISLREITDGAGCTLLISEDDAWQDGQWINGLNLFDQAYPINQAPPIENDTHSLHPGGANGLMADGAARFLAEEMDLKTLAAICTRAGGETVGEF